MKFKCIALVFAVLLTSSCCDSNEMSFSIVNTSELQNVSHSLCNSKEAVLLGPSFYNTNTGKATIYIPIPQGHTLKRIKQKNNTVTFITKGKNMEEKYDLYKVELEGLRKNAGDSLRVELTIKYSGKDKCTDKPKILGERKKGSDVGGDPLVKSTTEN